MTAAAKKENKTTATPSVAESVRLLAKHAEQLAKTLAKAVDYWVKPKPTVVAAHPVSEDWVAVFAGSDGPTFSPVLSVAYVQDGETITTVTTVGGRDGAKPAHLIVGFLGLTNDSDDDYWERANERYEGVLEDDDLDDDDEDDE